MVVRVGLWLSALAILIAGFFTVLAYLRQVHDVDVLDVAGKAGLGPVGVSYYWLVPVLVVIWVGVIAAAVIRVIERAVDQT